MTFEEIIKEIKTGVFKPVYFLSGEEPYFIDAIADMIEQNALTPDEKEFNQTIFYGNNDTRVADIIGAAKRFPLMADKQVIIVREAQNVKDLFVKDSEEKSKEKKKGPLEVYLENPVKSTVLVFCYKYKTIDKRTSASKLAAKAGVLFESKRLYDNQVADWIIKYVKQKGYSIQSNAAALIYEFVGVDLAKVVNALDKVFINIKKEQEITMDAVYAYLGVNRDYNTFELQNALGKKDILKSNQIVNYFAANSKENPILKTIPTLYSFFSKLLLYHRAPDKSREKLIALLKVNPYFLKDYEVAARNYPFSKVVEIISILKEFDLKAKGVDHIAGDDHQLYKEMIFKILH